MVRTKRSGGRGERRRGIRWVGWCGLLWMPVGGGCGRAAVELAAPDPRPTAEIASPAAPGEEVRLALLAALRELPPVDVLTALTPTVRAEVDDALAARSAAEQAELRGGLGVRREPLLHLAAGGSDPEAWRALATGGAAAALVELRLGEGRSLAGLAGPITALASAAATRWLADVALGLASPSGLDPERCGEIERVAAALGRRDLQLLAVRAAAALDPTVERQLALAAAAARELDVVLAREALAAAGSGADAERLAAVSALVRAAAALVEGRTPASDAETLLARGRALLALGRNEDARQLLAPHHARLAGHLGLTATLVLAEFGGSACPGLPPIGGNLLACAASWRESAVVQGALNRLEQAWVAGAGRDRAALEAYLGLAHVMPWLYASLTAQDAEPAVALEESMKAVSTLEARSREAATVEPSLAGLALFVELLRSGLEAAAARGDGARVSIEPRRRSELARRARELAPLAAAEPTAQAGILGVAAMLAQDTDPGPLLEVLPEQVAPRLRPTRAMLELWRAVSHQDAAAAERGRATILALVADARASGERSHLVLAMAEADAALRGRATDYATLYQVASQLDEPGLPRGTRLRLALDRAGALARTGRAAEAIQILSPLAEPEIRAGTATEVELGAMARAYLVVLRATAAVGSERDEYAAKLAGFAAEIEGQVAVGVALWHGLWMRELAARAAAERCRGAKACLTRVERARPAPPSEIEALVGAESARIVARGTVPLGAVTASFSYSVEHGLEPRVALDPLLLAVELPPPASAEALAPTRRSARP